MLQDIDLRELAEMQASGRDFVSLYCRGFEGLQALKSRERNLAVLLADNPDEAEHFELSMASIHELLEKNRPQVENAESICVFSCALLDFVRGHPLSLPVENQLCVGPSPFIRPLAELQDEYQTYGLVACDNSGTRIYLVTNRRAELEEQIRGGVKNHVRKGGWSQQRFSRRRDQQLQRYAREVAQGLEILTRQYKLDRLVLLGSKETMNEIENEMSPRLADLVVGKEPFDLGRGEDELLDEAYQAYFAEEREFEQRLWDRIKNEYMRHGLGVTGPSDVLDMLQQGRVDQVIATRDVEIPGTQCRDCDFVVHGTPRNCQRCGSSSLFTLDLIDTLVRQAQLTSAYFEFSDEIAGLTRVGHVAALLRY